MASSSGQSALAYGRVRGGSEARALSVSEPGDPGGQPLHRDVMVSEGDPVRDPLHALEGLGTQLVERRLVLLGAGDADPAEGADPTAEERTQIALGEDVQIEPLGAARLGRLRSD